MDELTKITDYPFLFGLAIGLVIAVFFWARSVFKARQLNGEIKKLREHLHTKFEIESADNERRKEELNQLRQERDNLRNMIQVLNQKPGKQEVRQTQIYQKAVETMFEKSPGFAPAWQITLKEAEEQVQQAERGLIPFLKRMTGTPGKALKEAEEEMRNAEKGIIPFFKRMTSSSPASYAASSSEDRKPRNRHLELEDPANL